jgi:hypothetical protein
MNILIRQEQAQDHDAVYQVVKSTFTNNGTGAHPQQDDCCGLPSKIRFIQIYTPGRTRLRQWQ